MTTQDQITLRPLRDEDIPLFGRWLDKDYIYKRLCPDGEQQREAWLDEVRNKDRNAPVETNVTDLSQFIIRTPAATVVFAQDTASDQIVDVSQGCVGRRFGDLRPFR